MRETAKNKSVDDIVSGVAITPDYITSVVERPKTLDNATDLLKYVVANCLMLDVVDQGRIKECVNNLKQTETYKFFESKEK